MKPINKKLILNAIEKWDNGIGMNIHGYLNHSQIEELVDLIYDEHKENENN